MNIFKKTLKAFSIVLIICVGIFALINIFWLITMWMPHHRVKSNPIVGKKIEDKYQYELALTPIDYLSFGEIFMVACSGSGITIYYGDADSADFSHGVSSGTLWGIYCYRNWKGEIFYNIDCWDPTTDFSFHTGIDKDLNVLENELLEDDQIAELEAYIAENYDEFRYIFDIAIEVWEG